MYELLILKLISKLIINYYGQYGWGLKPLIIKFENNIN
jgi:hypothetical protein